MGGGSPIFDALQLQRHLQRDPEGDHRVVDTVDACSAPGGPAMI
jgi:hypothetical protein